MRNDREKGSVYLFCMVKASGHIEGANFGSEGEGSDRAILTDFVSSCSGRANGKGFFYASNVLATSVGYACHSIDQAT